MRLLLDTHVFLDLVNRESDVAPELRDALDNAEAVVLSIASAWEISIKHGKGRLPLSLPPAELLQTGLRDLRMSLLGIDMRHALASGTLPPHHRDPFDRMLVAQAMCDRLTIVTSDRAIAAYDVPVLEGPGA